MMIIVMPPLFSPAAVDSKSVVVGDDGISELELHILMPAK